MPGGSIVRRCGTGFVGGVGKVVCIYNARKGFIVVLGMLVPSEAVSSVELVVMFRVVEDPKALHFVRVDEPASQWYFDVSVSMYKVMVEELSPDIPGGVIWSFLNYFFPFRSRGSKASDTFVRSREDLFTVCCTHIREPGYFKVVLTVEYFSDFFVGEGVTVTSYVHDTFVVLSRGEDCVDAVDLHVELMLCKEGLYVGVVVAFEVWCVNTWVL